MNISRRRLLVASGAACPLLAGCQSQTDPRPQESEGTTGEPLELAFGEGAEFTNDSGVAFQILLSDPRLIETVAVTRESEIYVDSPESQPYFLFVRVQVANEGDSPIDPPSGLSFEADGESIDRAVIRTPDQRYRDIGELAPGEQNAGIIAFPSPDGSGTGTVSLRFQRLLESAPAQWTFEFDDLPREGTDLTRDDLGDSVTVEAGDHAYEFTPTGARTTTSYTGPDGADHTAPDGSTFVMVDATAENVGEAPVTLPTPYDVRLSAGDSIARGTTYDGTEATYEGRVEPYDPGATQSGVLLFTVPESTGSYTLRLAIGNDTFVTWPIEPDGG